MARRKEVCPLCEVHCQDKRELAGHVVRCHPEEMRRDPRSRLGWYVCPCGFLGDQDQLTWHWNQYRYSVAEHFHAAMLGLDEAPIPF